MTRLEAYRALFGCWALQTELVGHFFDDREGPTTWSGFHPSWPRALFWHDESLRMGFVFGWGSPRPPSAPPESLRAFQTAKLAHERGFTLPDTLTPLVYIGISTTCLTEPWQASMADAPWSRVRPARLRPIRLRISDITRFDRPMAVLKDQGVAPTPWCPA